MSKYDPLWAHVQGHGGEQLLLTFDEIEAVTGFPIDHAFLTYKKELADYGYQVGKISMKERTVVFKQIK